MARTRGVSWLGAVSLAFPTLVSGVVSARCCPLQWRDRAGLAPASGTPVRKSVVAGNLCAATLRIKRRGQPTLQLGASRQLVGALGVGDLGACCETGI